MSEYYLPWRELKVLTLKDACEIAEHDPLYQKYCAPRTIDSVLFNTESVYNVSVNFILKSSEEETEIKDGGNLETVKLKDENKTKSVHL